MFNVPKLIGEEGAADIPRCNGLSVFIRHKRRQVTIIGEVNRPTSHLYGPNFTSDDYIQRSGGMTYKADKDRSDVIRATAKPSHRWEASASVAKGKR
jgi:protein involved in polysaccharide export with SLBB domain